MKPSKKAPLILSAGFALLTAALPGTAAVLDGASKLVVFGDSASSTTWNGAEYRWTNDLVWAEYLANSLGAGLFNYAVPGGYSVDDGSHFSASAQIANYYSDHGGAADPNSVHFYYLGANDLRQGVTPAETKANIAQDIQDLIDHGADNIILVNNWGSQAYTPAELSSYFPQYVSVIGLVEFLTIENLQAYGITNISTPCETQPTTCDSSLKWDTFNHPASGYHKAFAREMLVQFSSVPVPAAVWLFGSALCGLWGLRASRQR